MMLFQVGFDNQNSLRMPLRCLSLDWTDVAEVQLPQVEGEWTVDKVLDALPGDKPTEGTTSPLAFFHILEKLKTNKREGWRRFGINRWVAPSSVDSVRPD